MGEDTLIIDREPNSEVLVRSYLESMGISLLSEWDMLAFIYRHGSSLGSIDQIARLIGYEAEVVGEALDRLETNKLIERSGPHQGVRLHRLSTDVAHRDCLQQLVNLTGTRGERLLLTKLLKPVPLKSVRESHRLSPQTEEA